MFDELPIVCTMHMLRAPGVVNRSLWMECANTSAKYLQWSIEAPVYNAIWTFLTGFEVIGEH